MARDATMMMQLHRVAIAITLSLSITTFAAREAEAADTTPRNQTTLLGLVEDGNRFVTAAMAGTAPSGREATASTANPTAEAVEPPPFVDLLPRASLIARDWRGSMKVAGRTMLLDDLRPSASQRMVLLRVASDARLSPYTQVGAGEWRIDPVLLPALPSRQAMAGTIGAGFELRTRAGIQIAAEADYTFFYREGPVAADDIAPRLLTVLFAAQTSW